MKKISLFILVLLMGAAFSNVKAQTLEKTVAFTCTDLFIAKIFINARLFRHKELFFNFMPLICFSKSKKGIVWK